MNHMIHTFPLPWTTACNYNNNCGIKKRVYEGTAAARNIVIRPFILKLNNCKRIIKEGIDATIVRNTEVIISSDPLHTQV